MANLTSSAKVGMMNDLSRLRQDELGIASHHTKGPTYTPGSRNGVDHISQKERYLLCSEWSTPIDDSGSREMEGIQLSNGRLYDTRQRIRKPLPPPPLPPPPSQRIQKEKKVPVAQPAAQDEFFPESARRYWSMIQKDIRKGPCCVHILPIPVDDPDVYLHIDGICELIRATGPIRCQFRFEVYPSGDAVFTLETASEGKRSHGLCELKKCLSKRTQSQLYYTWGGTSAYYTLEFNDAVAAQKFQEQVNIVIESYETVNEEDLDNVTTSPTAAAQPKADVATISLPGQEEEEVLKRSAEPLEVKPGVSGNAPPLDVATTTFPEHKEQLVNCSTESLEVKPSHSKNSPTPKVATTTFPEQKEELVKGSAESLEVQPSLSGNVPPSVLPRPVDHIPAVQSHSEATVKASLINVEEDGNDQTTLLDVAKRYLNEAAEGVCAIFTSIFAKSIAESGTPEDKAPTLTTAQVKGWMSGPGATDQLSHALQLLMYTWKASKDSKTSISPSTWELLRANVIIESKRLRYSATDIQKLRLAAISRDEELRALSFLPKPDAASRNKLSRPTKTPHTPNRTRATTSAVSRPVRHMGVQTAEIPEAKVLSQMKKEDQKQDQKKDQKKDQKQELKQEKKQEQPSRPSHSKNETLISVAEEQTTTTNTIESLIPALRDWNISPNSQRYPPPAPVLAQLTSAMNIKPGESVSVSSPSGGTPFRRGLSSSRFAKKENVHVGKFTGEFAM